MQYIIKNKINIKKIYIIAIFLFVFVLPNISYADNLYGQTCGNTKCSQDEVCQKQYRGVLPIGNQNTGNATYTCVKPQNIEAPESPYKGDIGCGAGLGSGLTSGLGSIGSGFLNSVTGGILGSTLNTSLNNIAGDFLGNLTAPFGLKLDGTLTGILNDPIGAFTGNFTDLIGLDSILGDDCYYNNIDRVIDTRRLIAPLPVDLFNPLPLPVNVTSPTPLPVVVVDDLALYQQKELIDAPLAAQQKAKTIATVSDTLRYQISNDNLIPNNYFAINQLGIQFGAKDSETGVLPQAIDKYSSYANIPTSLLNGDIAKQFTDLQDPLISKLPPETFTGKCGNIKVNEATTLECQLLGLQTNNNANDLATAVAIEAAYKSQEASKLLDIELRDGNGYLAKADGDNVFTKKIQTPGSNISSLSEKVTEATIDQTIIASGDNCFEAIPKNILDGTLRPVLTQGLYGVNNTLASVISNTANDPVNSLQDPQGFANQLQSGVTGALPDPNRFFKSLQNELVNNVTSSLSCELNKQISGLLNGIIGNVNLPGIGNVSNILTNTLTNTITGSINNVIN
jgi:hypothetical protein